MVASLRYLDTFVKTDGSWLFAERRPTVAKRQRWPRYDLNSTCRL